MTIFEWISIGKELGLSSLIMVVAWMLVDKWAAQFLETQQKQAAAMISLSDGLKTAQSDQRDVLLAVRVQSVELKDVKDALHELTVIWDKGVDHDAVKN